MDPVLQFKLAQEQKLARRLRGTVTRFIDDWGKTDAYSRQALISTYILYLSKVLYEHQNRTSLIVRQRKLTPDHQLHRTDSNFLIGSLVASLIDFEENNLTKKLFVERIRKWATNTAVRWTQRDVEFGRWAKIQQSTNGLIYKSWAARMDGIERPDHHNAHLRYSARPIPINEPFRVGRFGGSLLRFPGDTALGAGPEQTFNCRCSVIYYSDKGTKLKDARFG